MVSEGVAPQACSLSRYVALLGYAMDNTKLGKLFQYESFPHVRLGANPNKDIAIQMADLMYFWQRRIVLCIIFSPHGSIREDVQAVSWGDDDAVRIHVKRQQPSWISGL